MARPDTPTLSIRTFKLLTLAVGAFYHGRCRGGRRCRWVHRQSVQRWWTTNLLRNQLEAKRRLRRQGRREHQP
jgi:hypothetical protein